MIFTLVPNRNLTVVTSTNQVLSIAKDNPNWDKILVCLRNNDEAGVIELMDMKKTVENFGSSVPKKGNIEIRGNEVFYRSEKLYGEDVNRIIAYLADKIPHDGMVNFLERKLNNPSKHSVDSMYGFLEYGGMPITPEGKFRAYKGVNNDFSSRNTGSEPLISGIRLPNGSIDNSIGQTIRMDRRYVCDDFNQPCGPGLHAGSLDYAIGWGNRVVIVEIDPADVVSVPSNEKAKLRCCAYTVVGEYQGVKMNDVYSEDSVPVSVVEGGSEDSGDDYCPYCGWENCDCELCDECENHVDACECCQCEDCRSQDNVEMTDDSIDAYQTGYDIGLKDGKSHQRRKHYESDSGKFNSFVDGYNAGYRTARKDE